MFTTKQILMDNPNFIVSTKTVIFYHFISCVVHVYKLDCLLRYLRQVKKNIQTGKDFSCKSAVY